MKRWLSLRDEIDKGPTHVGMQSDPGREGALRTRTNSIQTWLQCILTGYDFVWLMSEATGGSCVKLNDYSINLYSPTSGIVFLVLCLIFILTTYCKRPKDSSSNLTALLRQRLRQRLARMSLKQLGLRRLRILKDLIRSQKFRKKRKWKLQSVPPHYRSHWTAATNHRDLAVDEDIENPIIESPKSGLTFEERIEGFLSVTDVLSLHKCSTLLFEPTEQEKLRQIQMDVQAAKGTMQSWLNLTNYFTDCSSTLHQMTTINAGNIFLMEGDSPELPIVLDTGASKSLTPNRTDFILFKATKSTVSGIGAASRVEGVGTVRWKIFDQNGVETTIETLALYMPTARVRLYSPQAHFKEYQVGR